MSFRVFLKDAEGHALALEQGPDTAEVFEVETVREMRELLTSTTAGWWTDDDCEKHHAPVASFRVTEGWRDITEEVVDLLKWHAEMAQK